MGCREGLYQASMCEWGFNTLLPSWADEWKGISLGGS